MPTSRRELAVAALAARMDATRAEWDSIPEDEPFTFLVDGEESVISEEYGEQLVSVQIGIRRAVRAANDDARSTAANAVLAALKAETVGTDRTLGGLCENLRYRSGGVDIPTDGTDLIGASVFFDMDYRQMADSPY